jgi:hypothetical protein
MKLVVYDLPKSEIIFNFHTNTTRVIYHDYVTYNKCEGSGHGHGIAGSGQGHGGGNNYTFGYFGGIVL